MNPMLYVVWAFSIIGQAISAPQYAIEEQKEPSNCVIYIEQKKITLIEPHQIKKQDIQLIETTCPRGDSVQYEKENPENNPPEGSKL